MTGPKNASSVGPELVSAMPNDDARNKNTLLAKILVVVMGTQKGGDNVNVHPSRVQDIAVITGKFIVCCNFEAITTRNLVFSFIAAYSYNVGDVIQAYVI
jgi:hypothetical protein